MESNRKRKPLSDCTNTPPSSIKKPSISNKPSFAAAAKKLLNGDNVINSISKPDLTTTTTGAIICEVAAKSPRSVAITPSPAKSSRVSGINGTDELVESTVVYSRRRTAERRKSEGKEMAVPMTGFPAASIKTAGVQKEEDGKHYRKKKRHDSQHAMPQDIIEKQKAYFAEIDAFELSEEEVESADQLE